MVNQCQCRESIKGGGGGENAPLRARMTREEAEGTTETAA